MHYSSLVKMAQFAMEHDQEGKTVIDIGSLDINGTYRDLFPRSTYIGVDKVKGPNVDVIMDSKEWEELSNVDIVISGQTLEHVADIPKLMTSIFNVLKTDGLLIICGNEKEGTRAHWQGYHKHDLWFEGETLLCSDREGCVSILVGEKLSLINKREMVYDWQGSKIKWFWGTWKKQFD